MRCKQLNINPGDEAFILCSTIVFENLKKKSASLKIAKNGDMPIKLKTTIINFHCN